MLVAFFAIFAEAAADDLVEVRRDVFEGLGLCFEDGRHGGEVGVAGEGAAAGEHLVEERAEAEDVGADVDFLAFGLLGRHVGDGAQDGAFLGLRADGLRGVVVAGGCRLGELGEAEVEDFDGAVVGDDDVGGLDVAVDDAGGVGLAQAFGDLDGDAERFVEAQALAGDEGVEGFAGDVFHHQTVGAFVLEDVVDGDDVGMV